MKENNKNLESILQKKLIQNKISDSGKLTRKYSEVIQINRYQDNKNKHNECVRCKKEITVIK